MKILFSHSYYYQFDPKQWKNKTPYPPLGTIWAASFLRENGYQVALYDNALKENIQDFESVLTQEQPKYVVLYDDGFNYLTKMCLTNMREAAFEMISMAKEMGATVIVSSSDSTDHFAKYLEKGADFVLLGEAEMTLLDLINTLERGEDGKSTEGLCYREAKEVKSTGRRKVLKDLDELPLPAWDLIDIESYRSVWKQGKYDFTLNIATTRGCPYKCNWCAKPIYGNRYNSRTPLNVVNELEFLVANYGVSRFWICDDIFGLKPGWVQEFDRLLKERNLKIHYKIQSRADLLLKEDTIDALASSGLEEVWIGAESGSQKILDAMDKGITTEQIAESTTLLQQKGVRVAYFLQFGYLGETKEDVKATLNMLAENQPDDIGISVSYPLPGTPFFEKVSDQMGNKTNWTDSDELALMFKNTFNQTFYKTLHRFVHKIFRRSQAKQRWRKFGFSSVGLKALFKSWAYLPWIIYYRVRLAFLQNTQ